MRLHSAITSPQAATKLKTAFTPVSRGSLQRKCACGGTGGPCEDCRKKKLQRQAAPCAPSHHATASPGSIPPIVHSVLGSPGSPLDAPTRHFMESRFGHDFSHIRIHTDSHAAESARAVHASAYTVGSNIVFGAGTFSPGGSRSRRLLAHELTHVLQQARSGGSGSAFGIAPPGDAAEWEADTTAARVVNTGEPVPAPMAGRSFLQRSISVADPGKNIPNPGGTGAVQTNAQTIQNYLTTLCPTGSVAVNRGTGAVSISRAFCTAPALAPHTLGPASPSPAQASSTATGCGCICDLVASRHAWTIRVDDGRWPHTDFDDPAAADGRTPGGTGGTVTAPSPNSPKLWGAATTTGAALNVDPWLVLGHELCGHAWLGNSGRHGPDETKPRGEGGHQSTVARENLLRAEHGIDLRGTFKDPHCGESFWRDKAAPGTVHWSSYHSICERWRADYNRRHGTNYKITDRIP